MNTDVKRRVRTALAVICAVLLLSVGILTVSAAEQGFAATNSAKFRAVSDALNDLSDEYLSLDSSTDKSVYYPTNAVIGEYVKQTVDLNTSQESQTRDLCAEFDLLLAKGRLAAKITWISYLHTDASPNGEVLAVYADLREKTDRQTSAASVASIEETVCVEMNRAVFREKIKAQRLDTDTADTVAILESGIAKVEQCASSDIHGAQYILIYANTVRQAELQRARNSARSELLKIYGIIHGSDEGAESDHIILTFLERLPSAESISEVNTLTLEAAEAILESHIGNEGAYVSLYFENACKELRAAIAEASSAEECALLSSVLSEHSIRLHRARSKDEISALISSEALLDQKLIVSEYNADGGILDGCATVSDMELEKRRAALRIAWYSDYLKCKGAIDALFDICAAEDRLIGIAKNDIYKAIDRDICAVDRSADDAFSVCEKLASDGNARFDDLLCEARAEVFRIEHKEILSDTEIDVSDRARLVAALASYKELLVSDQSTAQKLSAEKSSIDEKYRLLIIAEINERYGQIKESTSYSLYDAASKEKLEEHHSAAVKAVENTSTSGDGSLDEILDAILSDAMISAEQTVSIAEVRLAAGDSKLASVAATLSEAEKAILSQKDIGSIQALRAEAVFRIGCQLKAQELRERSEALVAEIKALPSLGEKERAELVAQAEALIEACDSIAKASETTKDSLISSLETSLSALRAKAAEAELSAAKDIATAEVEKAANDAKEILDAYVYISADEKTSLSDKLDKALADFREKIEAQEINAEALSTAKSEALKSIGDASAGGEKAETDACRADAIAQIEAACADRDNYSESNLRKIDTLAKDAESELDGAQTVDEITAIRDRAIEAIEDVPSILDEAKAKAIEKLDVLYSELKSLMYCYSASVWAQIDEIYSHTVAEIEILSDSGDAATAISLADERCDMMKQMRMDRIYTADGILVGSAYIYPESYDIIRNGYAGYISLNGGIQYGAQFSVFPFTNPNVTDSIHSAIKQKKVSLSNGTLAGSELLSKLRGCTVITGLDMKYSFSDSLDSSVTVNLLLPNSIKSGELLGVVYLNSNGELEFYECTVSGQLLSFRIPHFSSFYIVAERNVDLLPLIIILALILFFEAAILIVLMMRRQRRVSNENNATLMALSPFSILPVTALTRFTPSGGIAIALILGALVLCAAGGIAYLCTEPRRAIKIKAENDIIPKVKGSDKTDEKNEENIEKAEKAPLPLPIRVGAEANEIREPLATVSAEDVDELMSDDEAQAALLSAPEEDIPSAQYKPHGKKHEINIDVISRNFASDETVSLATLKEKRLIPRNARAVKILARGTLDKPLCVIAQDFSTAAIKMITLTGGQAMLVDRDSE